jgi:hypothetical protein
MCDLVGTFFDRRIFLYLIPLNLISFYDLSLYGSLYIFWNPVKLIVNQGKSQGKHH